MQQGEMPFDGKRMFWGGFEKILDRPLSKRLGRNRQRLSRLDRARSEPSLEGRLPNHSKGRFSTMTDVRDSASRNARRPSRSSRRLHLVRADDHRPGRREEPSTTR